MERKGRNSRISRSRPSRLPRVALRIVVSAVVLVPVFVGQSSHEMRRESEAAALSNDAETPAVESFSVAFGERKSATLKDGSQLVMNTSTQVEVAIDQGYRHATLAQGEALLNVVEDPRRPFVLHAGCAEMETIAAKLLARAELSGQCKIHVLTGEAWLKPREQGGFLYPGARFRPMLVRAGEVVSMAAGVPSVAPFEPSKVDRALAWTEGEVSFLGETLAEAVAEFNRYNHRQLVVGDAEISNLRVGGRFESNDVDGFVTALQNTFGIRAERIRSGGAGERAVVLLGAEESRM